MLGRMTKTPVARHFNLPNHSKQHMAICGLSLHLGTTESRKNLEQKFIFQIGTLYSCFARCHVTTNSVAPTLLLKLHTTHNSSIRSDEGLTLETSAFRIPVRWSIYIINSVDKTKLLYIPGLANSSAYLSLNTINGMLPSPAENTFVFTVTQEICGS